MAWTTDRDAKLERHWHDGISTAEIGRRMGISKNAVIGRAHRLGLFRPSPLKPSDKPKAPPKPRRAPSVTLPDSIAQLAQQPIIVTRHAQGDGCQFIVAGERFRQRKCDAPRIIRGDTPSSYCAEHHAICYVRRGSLIPAVFVPRVSPEVRYRDAGRRGGISAAKSSR